MSTMQLRRQAKALIDDLSTTQLRDVGRIAAVINAVALTIEAEKS